MPFLEVLIPQVWSRTRNPHVYPGSQAGPALGACGLCWCTGLCAQESPHLVQSSAADSFKFLIILSVTSGYAGKSTLPRVLGAQSLCFLVISPPTTALPPWDGSSAARAPMPWCPQLSLVPPPCSCLVTRHFTFWEREREREGERETPPSCLPFTL